MTALKTYKESSTSMQVIQAVSNVFSTDGGASFGIFNTHKCEQARKTLLDCLVQIALDNRLPKESLERELEIAKKMEKSMWED
ncbi:hypothetical protein M422DRAFT_271321 [Sphaerobolus stellatus SS14]|uniref:Unplaced genomic scaffold SPHSTscaffold_259, whole genome shotgun sequence n=1 Tax=Sphaerobolus stellatus (strain SS14) TaxID=990650 RepID=A0A0C9UEP2_SPHS4|nr:hypothetical protein M422DRAFT_271321 [Sphaerobolus stellatus SS14]